MRSFDLGRTWQALSQDLPSSGLPPRLAFDGADPSQLYLGTDKGLYSGTFFGSVSLPLALVRGRFEARVGWRTSEATGFLPGVPVSLGDQNGIFWLFSPERAEVALQILDGRPLNGKFWIFMASMTDVELQLEVKDRLTGEVWRHHQAAGRPVSVAEFETFPHVPQPTAGALPHPSAAWWIRRRRCSSPAVSRYP